MDHEYASAAYQHRCSHGDDDGVRLRLHSASIATRDCTNLVSAGAAWRGDPTKPVLLFINGSAAGCKLKAPAVSLIDESGNELDVPQHFAHGANEAVLQLEAHQAFAVPYSITSLACEQTLRFVHRRSTAGPILRLIV
jgi:hypothetical protein